MCPTFIWYSHIPPLEIISIPLCFYHFLFICSSCLRLIIVFLLSIFTTASSLPVSQFLRLHPLDLIGPSPPVCTLPVSNVSVFTIHGCCLNVLIPCLSSSFSTLGLHYQRFSALYPCVSPPSSWTLVCYILVLALCLTIMATPRITIHSSLICTPLAVTIFLIYAILVTWYVNVYISFFRFIFLQNPLHLLCALVACFQW